MVPTDLHGTWKASAELGALTVKASRYNIVIDVRGSGLTQSWGKGNAMTREMWQAPSLEEAKEAFDQFCEAWADKYPKAV